MSILESPYFSLNKRVLKFYGQWPYQSKLQNRCHRIIVFLAVSSILLPKLIKMIQSRRDIDEFILCMPMVVVHIEAISNLSFWCLNEDEIIKLISRIQYDWEFLKTDKERKILDEYWKRGLSHIKYYAIPMTVFLIIFLISPGIPKIFDIIAPLNESRPHVFLYETEYFVNQDDYYFHILIHAYMTVPISSGLTIFYNTVFGCWIYHVTGMLGLNLFIFQFNNILYFKLIFTLFLIAVVAYQLETIHDIPESDKQFSQFEKNQSIQKRLAYSVKLHNDAIEFIEIVESSASTALFIVIICSSLILTVTGIVAVIKMDHPHESSRYLSFSFGVLGHLFFLSHVGNQIIKGSETVYRASYANKWYTLPIKCQKILIPIMVRTNRPCTFTAGKLYVLSMENFSELLKKAISLFTFINSTR